MMFIVSRAHMDKDGNHVRTGQQLDLSEDEARPYRLRGELMTDEEWAARQEAAARKYSKVTPEWHPYERW